MAINPKAKATWCQNCDSADFWINMVFVRWYHTHHWICKKCWPLTWSKYVEHNQWMKRNNEKTILSILDRRYTMRPWVTAANQRHVTLGLFPRRKASQGFKWSGVDVENYDLNKRRASSELPTGTRVKKIDIRRVQSRQRYLDRQRKLVEKFESDHAKNQENETVN